MDELAGIGVGRDEVEDRAELQIIVKDSFVSLPKKLPTPVKTEFVSLPAGRSFAYICPEAFI